MLLVSDCFSRKGFRESKVHSEFKRQQANKRDESDSASGSFECLSSQSHLVELLEVRRIDAMLKMTTTTLPDGSANQAYSTKLEVTGGTAPFTWSVTPPLPSGLALDASTGEIRGAPKAVSAKSTYTFTVKDSATPPEYSAADVTLEIKPATSVMDKMDKMSMWFLSGYLLLATVLTFYLVFSLWSLKSGASEIDWRVFLVAHWTINPEVQLLLLVLFTGAFGSCVYALKSLADFRGEDKLYASWLLFYVIQPFEGGGVAFLFYLLIRGGLLVSTGADVTKVNLFVVCGIAGLVGAFSDAALKKLHEVFQSLFQPTDDRGGKLTSGLKIRTTTLPDGSANQAYSAKLEVTGGTAPITWSVTPPLPSGLALDANTGEIRGTPKAVSAKSTYTFTVKDSAPSPQSSTVELTLEIK